MNDAATPGRRAPLSSAERAAVALLASGVVTFSTYGALTGAPSLAGYLAIVVGGLALLVWLRRSPLPDALAIGLSLVALGHLAGGLIRVGDDVLYNASPGIALLQWDHVVHSCGVFVGTILVWLFILQPVTRSLRTRDIVLVCVLAGLSAGFTNGSFAVLLTDLFPTRIRFTGVALVFNIGFTLFSGMAPLVATSLIRSTGYDWAPAIFIGASSAIALVGSFFHKRYGGNVIAQG